MIKDKPKYLLYFHRCANSGIHKFSRLEDAIQIAMMWKDMEGFYDLQIIDLVKGERMTIKKGNAEV